MTAANTASAEPILRFGVIGDTHVNPVEGESTSPWRGNSDANARARHAVAMLNRHDLDFVVHLGDMVHPVPELPTFRQAAGAFHAVFADLEAPLRFVPGNHDVGDKPGEWLPASTVNDEFVHIYRTEFGDDYYSFEAAGCHFIVLNAELMNSGTESERIQREWLQATLASYEGRRRFVFTHYPLFLHQADEPGHYDNIDEPARTWLLTLLEHHGVEAIFAGHVHNFFAHRVAGGAQYVAPSTAFVRHDYSELFRVGPAEDEEHGRFDVGKLGYFVVEVSENGHRVQIVRTEGTTRIEEETAALPRSLPNHARRSSPLVIDARTPWSETVDMSYTGGVDEFIRKRVRNDYPLMAMWDMHLERLRVPLSDLDHADMDVRARELASFGHRFSVFSYGIPDDRVLQTVRMRAAILDSWEIIVHPDVLPTACDTVPRLERETGLAIVLSPLENGHRFDPVGTPYVHAIRHGFGVEDLKGLEQCLAGRKPAYVAVRIPRATRRQLWQTLTEVAQLAQAGDYRARCTVQFAGARPQQAVHDEDEDARIAAICVLAAFALPELDIVLDTLSDMDRGYFPRIGLTDRRSNLRPAGRVVKHLTELLESGTGALNGAVPQLVEHERAIEFEFEGQRLVLPHSAVRLDEVATVAEFTEAVDLTTGEVFRTSAKHVIAAPTLLSAVTLLNQPTPTLFRRTEQ